MSQITNLEPPSTEYSDDILYGSRRDAIALLELKKLGNDTECVVFGVNTFVNKRDQWGIKKLVGLDKRLESMFEHLQVAHAFPLQRLCWPQLDRSNFPFLCISPHSSGKTYAYLLYIVSKCITKIPMKETEHAIASTDQLNSFKTQSMKVKLMNFDTSKINQADTDFDLLCQEDCAPNTSCITAETKPTVSNGVETNQDSTQDGWGLETKEHYQVNPDDFITHPKYIIVCSSQLQVDQIDHEIDSMKLAAFGYKASLVDRRNLPPILRTVTVHHSDEKLALKCNDSEILIGTSAAILNCLKLNFLTFTKCEKVIFDDLDITLQLHNSTVRELIKFYLIETHLDDTDQEDESERKTCRIYMFSRKWTLLVQQFVSTVFLQRTLIFGSIIEASLYVNLKYEIEIPRDINSKLSKISELVHSIGTQDSDVKDIAIVCKTNKEAARLYEHLTQRGHRLTFLNDDEPVRCLESKLPNTPFIYVLSDSALEQIEDLLNNVQHLIHFSTPDNLLVFDQRFRLMYQHIKNGQKKLISTIFINQQIPTKHAKEIYDVISRSNTTLNSTRLQLRDFISEKSNSFCWRWASTGVCRLEKLSREDKFGSYCSAKHSLSINEDDCTSKLPKSGQVRINMTHLVNPNEFYFRFESHRDKKSLDKKWTKLEGTGSDYMREFQLKLDAHKDTHSCSVPLERITKGKIFGIYLHEEMRVDRIILLEELKRDDLGKKATKKNGMLCRLDPIRYQLEYSKQIKALKIDYGVTINVYLRNIIELPQDIIAVKPQCYRGFHLGVKPNDGEPDWLYKAKKYFYDQVCVSDLYDITAWIRLNNKNCFWFENMTVRRRLSNIDENRIFKSEPHKELHRAGLAELVSSEPSCLRRSDRLETLSIWQVNECINYIQFAFLRKDKEGLSIFVMHILRDFDFIVRNYDYNKQLIELEDRICEDYNSNLLKLLNHFAPNTYCIAKIELPSGGHTFNRCRICSTPSFSEQSTISEVKFGVYCLDHGDECFVKRSDLFLASPDYFSQLPFQAITCRLANLNPDFTDDIIFKDEVRNAMYDFTRDERDDLKPMVCQFNEEGHISLYAPVTGGHIAMADYFDKKFGANVFVFDKSDPCHDRRRIETNSVE